MHKKKMRREALDIVVEADWVIPDGTQGTVSVEDQGESFYYRIGNLVFFSADVIIRYTNGLYNTGDKFPSYT